MESIATLTRFRKLRHACSEYGIYENRLNFTQISGFFNYDLSMLTATTYMLDLIYRDTVEGGGIHSYIDVICPGLCRML